MLSQVPAQIVFVRWLNGTPCFAAFSPTDDAADATEASPGVVALLVRLVALGVADITPIVTYPLLLQEVVRL